MKNLKNIVFEKYDLFLVVLVAFHTAFNFFWQKINTAPPTWDSAGHLAISFTFADRLMYFFRGELPLVSLIKTSVYYPPLVHFLGSIVLLVMGRNYEYPLFVIETVFFVIAVVFVYKLVNLHFADKRLALMSAFVFSFFPQIWEQSRNFHLDIPLCALLLVATYYLMKSDSLKNTKNAVLFFLFFALVQLTKWYGFVYLLVPLFYEVYYKIAKSKDFKDEKRLVNVFFGAVTFAVLVLPWYFLNLSTIISNAKIAATPDAGDPTNVFSYESIVHYLEQITSNQIGIISLVIVFLGLIALKKSRINEYKYISLAMVVPYAIFTLISNKDLRYVLPLAPYFSLLVSYWLVNTGQGLVKVLRNAFYFVYLFGFFLFMSLNQFQTLPSGLAFIGVLFAGPYGNVWQDTPWSYSYNNKDWQGETILAEIQGLADKQGISGDHFKTLELADNRFYSTASFDLYKLQHKYFNMDFVVPYYQFSPFTPQELQQYLSNINYALIPDYPGPPGLRNIAVLNQLVSFFKSADNKNFIEVKKFGLPDKNVITLYQRKVQNNQVNFDTKPASVVFRFGNILWLDKETYSDVPFDINMVQADGTTSTYNVNIKSNQIRLPLANINKFVIDLPVERVSAEQLQGWTYLPPNTFVRDEKYASDLAGANNSVFYQDLFFRPVPDLTAAGLSANVIVTKNDNKIEISLKSLTDTSYVAYATKGWSWNGVNLSAQNPVLTLPTEDLIQLEVTSPSLYMTGFDAGWGYFACYEGRAVCFYPLVAGFQ